jgi:hypothetical protein
MKILNGRNRLYRKTTLPILIEQGHDIVCCVRDINRFFVPIPFKDKVTVVEVDSKRRHVGRDP